MKRKVVLLLLILAIPCYLYSNDGVTITYTEEVYPGDAIIIKAKIDKEHATFESFATLYASGVAKKLVEVDLYKVTSNEYSAIIPLSSWYESGNFTVTLTYSSAEVLQEQVDLPIIMLEKDFIEETLYLNARNTSVKTDDSNERITQIEELNNILNTVNPDAVRFIGTFIHPVKTVYHTSYFGDRRNYEYSDGNSSIGLHYGLDYRAAIGTPVFACADGKVIMATMRNSSGNSIVIEHLPGFYSLYYHLDSMDVKVGDIVKQGDEIAKSGNTGLATGPHLHWEVRINGIAVDPAYFLETPLVME